MSHALSKIEPIISNHLAPAFKSAGFKRAGAAFVRKVDDAELTHVILVQPVQGRAGAFSLTVGITAPSVVYLWTGARDRSALLAGEFLEKYAGHELTGDPRHREFHADDPHVGLALERAAEKITVALRREGMRTWTALLRRTKSPARLAAILHHLGRETEARQILERELALAVEATPGDARARERERLLRAELRRFESPTPSSKRRTTPLPRPPSA